jgi:hypothetical protein
MDKMFFSIFLNWKWTRYIFWVENGQDLFLKLKIDKMYFFKIANGQDVVFSNWKCTRCISQIENGQDIVF